MHQKTTTGRDYLAVGGTAPATMCNHPQAAGLPLQWRGTAGFTLAELVISVGILVVLVLLFTVLLNSAATVTTLGHKQMDADSQARQLLDRMAIDFAQLVNRSDVDFFGKGTTAPRSVGGAMAGNDQIAFYSAVPGYYPSTGSQSPVSLVAYRVNALNTARTNGRRVGVERSFCHGHSCRLFASHNFRYVAERDQSRCLADTRTAR